jgi:hypothetical protein
VLVLELLAQRVLQLERVQQEQLAQELKLQALKYLVELQALVLAVFRRQVFG